MKTKLVKTKRRAGEFVAAGVNRFTHPNASSRTILIISQDKQLYEDLRALANRNGQIVVNFRGLAGTEAILPVIRPVAVLLDLDLPDGTAWEAAELLLKEPHCPPMILLTGRAEQFDIRTAIRAGALASKTEPGSRLLELVEEALRMPQANQAERNAIQRVFIGWLRPSGWAEASTPAYRFWGINE